MNHPNKFTHKQSIAFRAFTGTMPFGLQSNQRNYSRAAGVLRCAERTRGRKIDLRPVTSF